MLYCSLQRLRLLLRSMAAHTLPAYVHDIKRFICLACLFNCGVIILILASYGLLIPPSIFWLCWSILVIDAITFYTISVYWVWMENADKSGDSEQCHRHLEVRAVCLKVSMSIALIVMLFYNCDFSQRQNKILLFVGISIILCEGFPRIAVAKEDLKLPLVRDMKMARSIIEAHDWNAVIFLIPSAIHIVICVTGAIVLGGKLGGRLSDKVYWIVISILVVDFIAEVIHRFDCGNRLSSEPIPEKMPRRHHIGNVLRVVVGGLLCYSMIREICQKSYFPSNIEGKACEIECQESSRSLLKMVAFLVGIQAAVAFTFPFRSYILQCLGSREASCDSCFSWNWKNKSGSCIQT